MSHPPTEGSRPVDAESVDAESVDAEPVDVESVDAQSADAQSTAEPAEPESVQPGPGVAGTDDEVARDRALRAGLSEYELDEQDLSLLESEGAASGVAGPSGP